MFQWCAGYNGYLEINVRGSFLFVFNREQTFINFNSI